MDLRGWDVRVVAAGVVAMLVLAGCNGDAEEEVTPTPTPVETVVESASPSPSPSPTALTDEEVLAAIPEAARQENFRGAQEFARYFLENYPRLIQDARDVFTAVTDEGCVFCARTSEFFDEAGLREHIVEGGEVTVLGEVAQGGRQDDGTWVVMIDFEAASLTEHDATGEFISEDIGGPGVAIVALTFDGHWSVLEVAAEPK